MVNYFLAFIFGILFLPLTAQVVPAECGTIAKSSWANTLQQKVRNQNIQIHKTTQLTQIPYQIHLIVKANGTSALTIQQIRNEMDSVNAFYANANMFFFECSAPEIIYDDSLYNYEYITEELIVLTQNYTPDVINLYFANTVSINGTAVCGYSQFPPSVDYAVMAFACATNGSTLAHEIGHYFGLFHTHGDISQGELVDGSNCMVDGDLICDTPADPILSSSNVNSSCVYTGTTLDGNFTPYVPDVSNIMSYSRKYCRNKFSPDQYNVINSTMQIERSNLFCPFVTGLNTHYKQSYKLYPNPGTDQLSIELTEKEQASEVMLFNTLGACVYVNSFSTNNFKIDIKDLNAGIYFYVIKTQQLSYKGKWIKSE
ncbi:MAG: zinc-dependent metalloprotease [Bacteroidota bacterium]